MGNDHSSSRTNLGKTCTSFHADATCIEASWGDSLVVFTRIKKEDDRRDVWVAAYKIGTQRHRCYLKLRARQDNYGVESINFVLGDYADNKTDISVDITRVGRDGLREGITGIEYDGPKWIYINYKQDYSIETTLVPYSCPYREGLFVLQKKKMNYSDNAYMVTMAHYYVTNAFGLCVWAEICHRKGKGFVVEVKGPFKHSSADLRRVIDETRRTGVWSTGANSNAQTGDSNPSWKSNNTVAQNHGNEDSFNNLGNGNQNSNAQTGDSNPSWKSNNTLAQIVKRVSNYGNEDSFNNLGDGNQNFSHAKIYQKNSWCIINFQGDRNKYRTIQEIPILP